MLLKIIDFQLSNLLQMLVRRTHSQKTVVISTKIKMSMSIEKYSNGSNLALWIKIPKSFQNTVQQMPKSWFNGYKLICTPINRPSGPHWTVRSGLVHIMKGWLSLLNIVLRWNSSSLKPHSETDSHLLDIKPKIVVLWSFIGINWLQK